MAGYSVTYTVVDNATKTINDINKKIQQLRAPMEQQAKAMSKFLDVSGLQKVSDGFGAVARTSADAFSSLARMVPVMGAITGAASLAGLASLVKGFTDLGTQLERNADYLGTSTTNLNQWQNAVKLAGGSVENLNEGMKEVAKTGYEAVLGRNAIALRRFNEAGIATNDLMNKSATELMPQVLDYINKFTDARDRETVATQLGGKALYELNEDFRLSGKSYAEWMEAAKKYGAVLDPDRLRRYRQAIGELDVAFSGLGTEITDVMATALTPMIKDLSTWVHENQPEIIAAIKEMGEVVKWVGQHAKEIAEVFAVLWGVKAVAGVVSLITQVRALNAALSTGLLGKLGLLGMAAGGAMKFGRDVQQGPPELPNEWGISKWLNPAYILHKAFGGSGGPSATGTIPPPGTVPPPGTTPPPSPATPGQGPVSSLATERQRFAQELKDNPALREKLINIAATEQSNPHGNQAVIETMMNRAAAQGTSLASQVRRTSEGGYYAGSDNPAAVAANRSMIEGNLDKVLAGSNISNFATDNASNQPGNQLAAKRINNNEMQLRYQAGGEYFFSPSNPAISGAGTVGKYNAWLAQHPNVTPAAAGGGGSVIPGGRGSAGVNPALDETMRAAWAAVLPKGWTARMTAGQEGGHAPNSQHHGGNAQDWQIYDQDGKPVSNRGADVSGLYQKAAVAGLDYMQQKYPELAKRFAWGGHFETSAGSGVPDLMHYDIGGVRGRFGDPLAERKLLAAQGSPLSVAASGKPASGSVDVTVTHKNAPPGTTVSGTAEGAGVNLIGPRIEQQQLSAA